MITRTDLLIAISNSGETAELVTILPLLKRLGIPLITLTGNPAPPWPKPPRSLWISACARRPAR